VIFIRHTETNTKSVSDYSVMVTVAIITVAVSMTSVYMTSDAELLSFVDS